MQGQSVKQVVDLISLKNEQVRMVANSFDYDFVDCESVSKTRIDAHNVKEDCSHYCQPGLPDVWSDMFATTLCEVVQE
eukprot:m.126547 g.126547  ORF g.126547 m.126547 type:complete len:78 (-) comp23506_c1_seq2:68-301(-)